MPTSPSAFEPTQQHTCPTCQGNKVRTFFGCAAVPVLCNVLHTTRDEAIQAPRGDIELAFCVSCGMIFNRSFDPRLISYDIPYENALHHSPRFRRELDQLVRHLARTYGLQGKRVLEIGSGDGYFLRELLAQGAAGGVGFDPSLEESAPIVETPGLQRVRDYFRASLLAHEVDLICCRHVLEHNPQPQRLLDEVRVACSPNNETVVFFEVPNGRYTIEQLAIWDILYEHCSYFTPPSLDRLFRECGFRVLRLQSAYEGQFLRIEALPARGAVTAATALSAELDQLTRGVERFAEQYQNRLEFWNTELDKLGKRQQRVALWGAGTKGVMFLNSVDAAERLGCVIDINPRKLGCYIAGTGHRIEAPAFLAQWKPDVVLLMNPIYQAEIRATLHELGLAAEVKLA